MRLEPMLGKTGRLACALAWAMVFILVGAGGAGATTLKVQGSGLETLAMRSVQAAVFIDGPFARTRTVMVFHNPLQRQVEADFVYTAPPGAVIHYVAYWYRKEKVVARIVARERAAEIYRSITARRRDPALIESMGNRRFRVRIFPIEATSDLKVELRTVQVLPASQAGFTYVFPFDAQDVPRNGLDSADIQVRVRRRPELRGIANNYGLPLQGDGAESRLLLQAQHFKPHGDYKVTLQVAPRVMQAFVHAAREGGAKGFFALLLNVGRAIDAPRVTLSGPALEHVVVERSAMLGAHGTLLVTGRYGRPGRLHLALRGKSGPASRAQVDLGGSAEKDNPAATLWAAARIGDLEEHGGSPRTIAALSRRYNLPSRYTSWLAVPKAEWALYQQRLADQHEENKRRAHEMLRARRVVPFIEAGRLGSPQGKRLFQGILQRGSTSDVQEFVADRWRTLVETGQAGCLAAKRLEEFAFHDLEGWQQDGSQAQAVFSDRMAQLVCAGERNTRRYQRLREALIGIESRRARSAQDRKQAVWRADSDVATGVQGRLREWMHTYGELVAQGRESTAKGVALLRQIRQCNARLAPRDRLSQNDLSDSGVWGADLHQRAYELASARHATPRDPELVRTLQHQFERMCRSLKVSSSELQARAEQQWRARRQHAVHQELRTRYAATPRDADHERRLEAEYRTLDPKDGPEMIERIRVNVELERLDEQLRTNPPAASEQRSALAKRREYLVAKAAELRARFGDPLIQVEAPADARQVTAILPDGQIKPMAWNERSRRWEAHFDIPTHVTEGRYEIQVVVVDADGRRETQVLSYEVRLTPPDARVTVRRMDERVAMLECEPATGSVVRRVVATLPWGERTELVADREGRRWWQRVEVPEAYRGKAFAVGFIVTDAAHNRREMTGECAVRCDVTNSSSPSPPLAPSHAAGVVPDRHR